MGHGIAYAQPPQYNFDMQRLRQQQDHVTGAPPLGATMQSPQQVSLPPPGGIDGMCVRKDRRSSPYPCPSHHEEADIDAEQLCA
jgi:hypothetical protein